MCPPFTLFECDQLNNVDFFALIIAQLSYSNLNNNNYLLMYLRIDYDNLTSINLHTYCNTYMHSYPLGRYMRNLQFFQMRLL